MKPAIYGFLIIFLKLIVYCLLLIVVRYRDTVYPFSDLGGFWAYAVDRDSLLLVTFLSNIGVVLVFFSVGVLLLAYCTFNRNRCSKSLLRLLLAISAVEIIVFVDRFAEFRAIASSLEDCKTFSFKSLGCYFQNR